MIKEYLLINIKAFYKAAILNHIVQEQEINKPVSRTGWTVIKADLLHVGI